MSHEIEKTIRDHYEKRIGHYVKEEYELQIGKWKRHVLARATDCAAAFKLFEATLKTAEQDLQQAWQLTMLALSLISGLALSWVAGAIQYALYPALVGRSRHVAERIQLISNKNKTLNWTVVGTQKEYSKIAAKVYGDLGGSVAQIGSEKMILAISPTPWPYASLSNLGAATSPEVFSEAITNLLSEHQDAFKKTIENVAIGISETPGIGKSLLSGTRVFDSRQRHEQA